MTNVNVDILGLPIATSLTGSEAVVVVQGGTTKQATAAALGASGVIIRGTYANNAAALAGGLTVGQFYKTSTGVVMVVF